MTVVLIVLALVVVVAALVYDFIRNGPRPQSVLTCTTCPKLAQKVRWYQVVLLGQLLAWGLSLIWAVGR